MVRLKQGKEETIVSGMSDFNPTMVRLKLSIRFCVASCNKYFNPTMVRLKHGTPLWIDEVNDTFQSHNGSIKTHFSFNEYKETEEISIPQWFD